MALGHRVIVAIAAIRIDQPGFVGKTRFLLLRNDAAVNGLIVRLIGIITTSYLVSSKPVF